MGLFKDWGYTRTGVIRGLGIKNDWGYKMTGLFEDWEYTRTGVIG
jgi:hypothetical protein